MEDAVSAPPGKKARPDLNAEKTAVTRVRILAALAALVREEGVHDFSVQEVADRAGVSHRTVYRHFETREALLNGLVEWLDERIEAAGGLSMPESVESIPDAVVRNFQRFDEFADLLEALIVVTVGSQTPVALRTRRTEQFQSVLRPLADHLTPEMAEAAGLLIRLLASSRTWLHFREESVLDSRVSGQTVAWALGVLLDDLRTGGGPSTNGRTSE